MCERLCMLKVQGASQPAGVDTLWFHAHRYARFLKGTAWHGAGRCTPDRPQVWQCRRWGSNTLPECVANSTAQEARLPAAVFVSAHLARPARIHSAAAACRPRRQNRWRWHAADRPRRGDAWQRQGLTREPLCCGHARRWHGCRPGRRQTLGHGLGSAALLLLVQVLLPLLGCEHGPIWHRLRSAARLRGRRRRCGRHAKRRTAPMLLLLMLLWTMWLLLLLQEVWLRRHVRLQRLVSGMCFRRRRLMHAGSCGVAWAQKRVRRHDASPATAAGTGADPVSVHISVAIVMANGASSAATHAVE
mmetsp:Transcript_32588/g.97250  ORF Transcript_32588/g.97250 Transcript_32588/m.97250 type:complete len:303 (-) Transcript_32588:375-1283(-)